MFMSLACTAIFATLERCELMWRMFYRGPTIVKGKIGSASLSRRGKQKIRLC